MADWDSDSPQLRKNLTAFLKEILRTATRRDTPSVEAARLWQKRLFEELKVPKAHYVGKFRGEPGLEKVRVRVGGNYGVEPANVAEELRRFEVTLRNLVAELDASLPTGKEPNGDQLAAIIDLAAWVYAEWIRIHPFANGNGRTARLWANSLAMRYNLPPFVQLRPRPNTDHALAGAKAMQSDWKPTVIVFRRLLDRLLDELS